MGGLLNQFLLVKGSLVKKYHHQQEKEAGDVQQQVDPRMDGGNFHLNVNLETERRKFKQYIE
jgi:hypothetical protein